MQRNYFPKDVENRMINTEQYEYANIIIDISHEKVDRVFQYRIPEPFRTKITIGMPLLVPFGKGNTIRTGYVVELTNQPDYEVDKIKMAVGIAKDEVLVETQLICLAWWMKRSYGSTMNQALKTVLPVRQKVREKEQKLIRLVIGREQLEQEIHLARQKHYTARARLLSLFLDQPSYTFDEIKAKTAATMAVITPLADRGILSIEKTQVFRNPVSDQEQQQVELQLTAEQQVIISDFCDRYDRGDRTAALIHGVTGSGKTEVYMEMIRHVLKQDKQVIVLIPEIALTYQTVERFYRLFGNRISIINSRLSKGERYDQFERAKSGDVSIMIGPRSALFTPFANLGLIIIDEEHEGAYKSEVVPRYHAREVAFKRAEINQACVVLGSATPSLESYTMAVNGKIKLYQMTKRAKLDSRLADVEIIDLRKELEAGNKSIFSRRLFESMKQRLEQKEQIMLFINRRGFANFVSCRSCGIAMKCPHCDVSLTLHNHGNLVCHYCGYSIPMPKHCPSCTSPYIAQFGVGTQKLESMTAKTFPEARILRMDFDTTSKKGGHEQILGAFARHEADILIGTQMIVKGHDFPAVTLVGVVAADLSLHEADFRSGERTFQLLTQAAGRAGRAQKRGEVIVQTYQPDHYSIVTAAEQNFEAFYRQEMAYRSMLSYPPAAHMMIIQFASKNEPALERFLKLLMAMIGKEALVEAVQLVGPVNASVYKVNDIYRKILYMKQEKYDILIRIKDWLNDNMDQLEGFRWVQIQYDFS